MTSLERLLDGLDVDIDGQPAAVGADALMLAGGVTVRLSPDSVTVLPARAEARVALPRLAPAPQLRPFAGDGPRGPWAVSDAETGTPPAHGGIRATYQGSVGLFDHLREPLVARLTPGDPIHRSFKELLDEIAAQRPGMRAMTEALVRRCLILLLRRCWEHGGCRASWMAALEDTRLGRAVQAMQDRPEQSFTLPRLAELAGMSRSIFAARFAQALGQSPIEFLKALRLVRAAQLLSRTELAVKVVAARVGYSSRSSFTRAFVAHHGMGPLAFRLANRGPVDLVSSARPRPDGDGARVMPHVVSLNERRRPGERVNGARPRIPRS